MYIYNFKDSTYYDFVWGQQKDHVESPTCSLARGKENPRQLEINKRLHLNKRLRQDVSWKIGVHSTTDPPFAVDVSEKTNKDKASLEPGYPHDEMLDIPMKSSILSMKLSIVNNS